MRNPRQRISGREIISIFWTEGKIRSHVRCSSFARSHATLSSSIPQKFDERCQAIHGPEGPVRGCGAEQVDKYQPIRGGFSSEKGVSCDLLSPPHPKNTPSECHSSASRFGWLTGSPGIQMRWLWKGM